MTRHIAILLTNTDVSAFALRYPNDGLKVVAALQPLRPSWSYRVYHARDGELPASLEGVDGVIITGSPASVNDDLPWVHQSLALVRQLHAQHIPTLGLCFGHQLIAKALGGTVQMAANWGLGVSTVNLVQHRPWMVPPVKTLHLFAAHQEQVTQLPPEAILLGGDDACPVGMYAVGHHMLAVQYHPELTRDFMSALLDHIEPGMPSGVVPRARLQLAQAVDAPVFFHWAAQFLEQQRTLP